MAQDETSGQKELPSDFTDNYDLWKSHLALAEKAARKWIQTAEQLSKKYAAKTAFETEGLLDSKQPYHVFYSNVAVLQPAVYSRVPKVVAQRRFKDRDPVGRLAAIVLERALSASLEQEDFDPAIRAVRDDWLIRSRGVAREYFDAQVAPTAAGYDDVLAAKSETYYVHWRDFLCSNRRQWCDVERGGWVSFKVLMDREKLVDRFGKMGKDVPLDAVPEDVEKEEKIEDKEPFKQANIFEIWDSKSRSVIWLSKSHDKILDVQQDPLRLSKFFPCPRPLFGALDNEDLFPTADYIFYSDLAEQLNLIQWKIDCLTRALKVVGAYDASCEELKRILSEDCEFELIPVKNWPTFSQAGGLQGAIVWMPLGEIVKTLRVCYEAQERTIARINETSGISDILRGYGDPRATASAEKIKQRFASARLEEKQREMARFIRDLIRIKAEIIAEHFSDQALALVADVDQMKPEDQQMFPQAVQLLRDDKLRTFRIDIETDSTVMEDEGADREETTAFISSAAQFMGTALEMGAKEPALVPVLGEMLMLGVRTFRKGRTLENALEEALSQIQQKQQAGPPEQPPDPKMMEVQAKAQAAQVDAQNKAQMKQMEMQQKAQLEQVRLGMEQQRLQQEYELKLAELQADINLKLKKLQLDGQVEQNKAQIKADADLQAKVTSAIMAPKQQPGPM